jgi:homocysteine S-methyltransferase
VVNRKDILTRLGERPLLFDGAMGTMIYQRGVFLNTCYDELCLTKPDLIRDIHVQYVRSGVDVLETNSFSANRAKLADFGLADKVEDINRAAVRLAREAADESVYVAASVGPCLKSGAALILSEREAVASVFDEQIRCLVEEGIDLLALETFHDLNELLVAVSVAASYDVPVLASFTVSDKVIEENDQFAVERAVCLAETDGVDLVGLNCGLGPAKMFHPLKHVIEAVNKPVVAMPNAGGPSEVGGRQLYLNSPEFFAEFCKRYVELGVRGLGGCCGTTPGHLAMASRAVLCMSGVKEHVTIADARESDARGAETPLAEKSPFGARLAAGERVASVELLPPRNGAAVAGFIEKCRRCQEAGVDAINLPDGPRASARLSVVSASVAMQQAGLEIESIPHYCCRDRNLIGMQSDLLGGYALGLKTWLFITGDPPKLGNYPDATGVFDVDAIGLCRMVTNLNCGLDAAGNAVGDATAMVKGVGSNPVAVEGEREVERYFQKIEAGAEFTITQPVFDPEALLRFLDRVRTYHRTIPVIAGIYPLISFRNADFMNQHVPGVVVPAPILERMQGCTTKEDGVAMGIEISHEICERVSQYVDGFQVSAPLGRVQGALDILAQA